MERSDRDALRAGRFGQLHLVSTRWKKRSVAQTNLLHQRCIGCDPHALARRCRKRFPPEENVFDSRFDISPNPVRLSIIRLSSTRPLPLLKGGVKCMRIIAIRYCFLDTARKKMERTFCRRNVFLCHFLSDTVHPSASPTRHLPFAGEESERRGKSIRKIVEVLFYRNSGVYHERQ